MIRYTVSVVRSGVVYLISIISPLRMIPQPLSRMIPAVTQYVVHTVIRRVMTEGYYCSKGESLKTLKEVNDGQS